MPVIIPKGFDELISATAALADDADSFANEIIDMAGEELVKGWKNAIKEHGLIDTGAMYESIKDDIIINETTSEYRVEISPKGKDKNGVRNAEKAYINHYGRGKKAGTHFVDEAESTAQKKVDAKTEEIYDSWIKKHFG